MRSGSNVANVGVLGAETTVCDGTSSLHVSAFHAFDEVVCMVEVVVIRRLNCHCLNLVAIWYDFPTFAIGDERAIRAFELEPIVATVRA